MVRSTMQHEDNKSASKTECMNLPNLETGLELDEMASGLLTSACPIGHGPSGVVPSPEGNPVCVLDLEDPGKTAEVQPITSTTCGTMSRGKARKLRKQRVQELPGDRLLLQGPAICDDEPVISAIAIQEENDTMNGADLSRECDVRAPQNVTHGRRRTISDDYCCESNTSFLICLVLVRS